MWAQNEERGVILGLYHALALQTQTTALEETVIEIMASIMREFTYIEPTRPLAFGLLPFHLKLDAVRLLLLCSCRRLPVPEFQLDFLSACGVGGGTLGTSLQAKGGRSQDILLIGRNDEKITCFCYVHLKTVFCLLGAKTPNSVKFPPKCIPLKAN